MFVAAIAITLTLIIICMFIILTIGAIMIIEKYTRKTRRTAVLNELEKMELEDL